MKTLRIALIAVAAATAAIAVAACGEQPTAPAAVAPSFNGGITLGGGHRDSDTTTVGTTSTTSETDVTTPADTTTGRTGVGLGSGH